MARRGGRSLPRRFRGACDAVVTSPSIGQWHGGMFLYHGGCGANRDKDRGAKGGVTMGPTPETGMYINLFSNLGALTFILWLVWRTTNHTIPRLAKSFEDGLEKARLEYRETLAQQRQDFRDILCEQRDFFADRIESEETKTDKIIQALKEFKAVTQTEVV